MKLFPDGFRGTPAATAPHDASGGSATTSIDQQIASLGASPDDAVDAAKQDLDAVKQDLYTYPSTYAVQPPPREALPALPRQADWTSETANILAIAFVFTAVDLVVIEKASPITAALFLSTLHMAIVLLFHITGKRLMAIHCGIAGPLAVAVTFSFLYLI